MKVILGFAAILAIGVVAVVFMAPPLLPSNCVVSYTINGKTSSDAIASTPLFMASRVYVHLPKDTDKRYSLFLVDFARRVVIFPFPTYKGPCGIEYIHRD